jgi:hypothetical protein
MGASGNQPVENAFQGASQAMQQAGQTYGGLTNFQAPKVGPVGSLATANMQQYMSPYTEQVIERGQADIMRQQQQGMNQLGAQATAAKAFGGSRHGVAEGVAAGEYGRLAGDFAAQQREKAYQQALGAAQYDIGQQQQRALADQQAALTGAGIQQTAAGGLAGLGGQAFGMGQATQAAVGEQAQFQRKMQQQLLDLAKQQYMGQTGAPLAGLGALSQILGGTPYGKSTTTSQPFNPATLLYAFL